jgi:hypothetical protein
MRYSVGSVGILNLRATNLASRHIFLFIILAITTCLSCGANSSKVAYPKLMNHVSTSLRVGSDSGPVVIPQYLVLWWNKSGFLRAELASQDSAANASVTIVNGADWWIINPDRKTGLHRHRSGGPVPLGSVSPFGPPAPDWILELNFGEEYQFFASRKAQELGVIAVNGDSCNGYELAQVEDTLMLLCDPQSNEPRYLSYIGKDQKVFRYDGFELGVPFDSSKFRPPSGIDFEELK